jgi:hypothetical protein
VARVVWTRLLLVDRAVTEHRIGARTIVAWAAVCSPVMVAGSACQADAKRLLPWAG